MPNEKTPDTPAVVPPVADPDDERKPGPGEVAVTSPVGTRSIVAEDRADSLKAQGYTIGK